ncbi:MAG: PDZ domain-containing protein, partial [Clostridia bacterium]|nr:PDZ domain-containing protein [Clostridia bacterium]
DQRRWYAFGKGVGKDKEYIDAIVTPLTETEKRLAEAWTLGVTGVRVDPEVAESYSLREGLLVTKLTPGSPMDAAGLAAGDVLLAIGETPILGNSSLDRAKASIAEGDTVTVLFLRNGEVYQTTLTRPSEAQSL